MSSLYEAVRRTQLRSSLTKTSAAAPRTLREAVKLAFGMQMEFNSPQEQQKHEQRKKSVGVAGGFVGSMAGGAAGGALGSAGGPAGNVAGGLAGSAAGEAIGKGVTNTALDIAHDVPYQTKKTYNNAMSTMNRAAGIPSGPMNTSDGVST